MFGAGVYSAKYSVEQWRHSGGMTKSLEEPPACFA